MRLDFRNLNQTKCTTLGFQFRRTEQLPPTDLPISTPNHCIHRINLTLRTLTVPSAINLHHEPKPSAPHSVFGLAGQNTRPSPNSPHIPHRPHPTYSHYVPHDRCPSRTETECTALGFWFRRAEHLPQPNLPLPTPNHRIYHINVTLCTPTTPPTIDLYHEPYRIWHIRFSVFEVTIPAPDRSCHPHLPQSYPPRLSYPTWSHHASRNLFPSRTNTECAAFGSQFGRPKFPPRPILPSLTPIAVFTISMSHYGLPPRPPKLISITDEYRMQHIRSSVLGVKIPAHTRSLHPRPSLPHLPLIPHPRYSHHTPRH